MSKDEETHDEAPDWAGSLWARLATALDRNRVDGPEVADILVDAIFFGTYSGLSKAQDTCRAVSGLGPGKDMAALVKALDILKSEGIATHARFPTMAGLSPRRSLPSGAAQGVGMPC